VRESDSERASERQRERERERDRYGISLKSHCHLVELRQILQNERECVSERKRDR